MFVYPNTSVYVLADTYDQEPGCRINVYYGKAIAGILSGDHFSLINNISTRAMLRKTWPIRGRAVGHMVDPLLLQKWFGDYTRFHRHDISNTNQQSVRGRNQS